MNNYLSEETQYAVNELLSKKQAVYVFIKNNEEYITHSNEIEGVKELFIILTTFYVQKGMPDRIEFHSGINKIDFKKVRIKHTCLSQKKIHEKIVRKYESVANSPYAIESILRVVYKEDSVDMYYENKFQVTIPEHGRQFFHDSNRIEDLMLIAKKIRETDETGELTDEIKADFERGAQFISIQDLIEKELQLLNKEFNNTGDQHHE